MNNSIPKQVRVLWNDAVIYDQASNISAGLSQIKTTGNLVKETSLFIIIQNPKSKNLTRPKAYHKPKPTFLYVPKGMVEEIKYL